MFFGLALMACGASLWVFIQQKHRCRFAVRAIFLSVSLVSLAASVMPALALWLTVSFVPSFIYHSFKPLMLAPFVVPLLALVGSWCVLITLQEFAGFLPRHAAPPQFGVSFVAMLIVVVMGFKLHAGVMDYTILVDSPQLIQYALTGKNPDRLIRIYRKVALSHDAKLFDELLSALSLNHHASPELLTAVYTRTTHSDMDVLEQNYILTNLSSNPATSTDLLNKLMVTVSQVETKTKSDDVLTTVSQNPNFSSDTLLQLTHYPDCEIRRAIIAYPNISPQVLDHMISSDPDLGIRHDAKRRLEFLHGMAPVNAEKITRNVEPISTRLTEQARNSIDPRRLASIYDASQYDENANTILENLASNCYLSADILRRIYDKALTFKGYARTAILLALAVNPKTPSEVLQKLAAEKDLVILRGLASNASLPHDVINHFVPLPDCKIRKALICLPATTQTNLQILRGDRDESVALEATERFREETAYLNVCREMKKLTPSCQKYYGNAASPDLRAYPNTSQVSAPQPLKI
jgi:hypothetical protein